jgi:hypothetical protein
MKSMHACRIERADFRGWPAVYLRNDLVTLVAVPDIGGRIMAYDLGDYPFLFVDRDLAGKLFSPEEHLGDGSLAAWKNYGGDKTWPAPQGWDNEDEWHGPPDPALDSGRYTLLNLECEGQEASVQMLSPPDPRTGLQITRQVALRQGSSRIALDLSFTNISEKARRWSIWDVVQLRAERSLAGGRLAPETSCMVTAPLNPHSRFPRGYQVMFGEEDNPQWTVESENRLFAGHYRWEIGKVGLDSTGGWIAFSNSAQGYAFAARFAYFPDAEYPDQGASVECWTVGKGKVANLDYAQSQIYLMEAEVLSPLYTLQAGERRSFRIEWGACRCAGKVVEVNEAGCVHQPLAIHPMGPRSALSGSFGVFDLGSLQLVWLDQHGAALETVRLGDVSPQEQVHLELTLQTPDQAAGLELQVLAEAEGSLHQLARLRL